MREQIFKPDFLAAVLVADMTHAQMALATISTGLALLYGSWYRSSTVVYEDGAFKVEMILLLIGSVVTGAGIGWLVLLFNIGHWT